MRTEERKHLDVLLTMCQTETRLTEVVDALEQAGIEYRVVRDESSLYTFANSGSTATLSVFVSVDDYPTALEIVKGIDKKAEEAMPWCPQCGSENVERYELRHKRGPWVLLIIGLFMIGEGIFIPPEETGWVGPFVAPLIGIGFLIAFFKGYTETIYRCRDCGLNFKRK